MIFNSLQVLSNSKASLFSCVLWSIWKQRNNKVWDDIVDAQSFVLERAKSLLFDWELAQKNKLSLNNVTNIKTQAQLPRLTKCNIDASFPNGENKTGIGICIRDDDGAFVLARTELYAPRCGVHIGEALGLLSALQWVHDLILGPIDFELDSKKVVDSFASNKHNAIEFGSIVQFYENSSVEFVRRQANAVAHELAKAATLGASFQIVVTPPRCIEHLLINEMI